MTIRYGFDDYQEGAVNINPAAEKLHTEDPAGTDYKLVLDELPLFWKPYIREIVQAPGLDEDKMNQAYDLHLLEKTRVRINWHHVGALFDESNWPDPKCINNHTKEYVFY